MPSSLNPENQIKAWAQELGFLACGFAKAEKLDREESHLDQWLANGFHGNMQYMENHRAMRLDPTLLVPGSKSVISLAFNYYPENKKENKNNPQIAKYAWGDDYHHVIKDKLFKLIDRIKTLYPEFEGRAFVDSAPVMERQWAVKAGLGWIGKNSLLLRKGVGSFFFLAEIIGNIDLTPDQPQTDHCGECTACIDACPTQAIVQPRVIDSTRCISYLTIEDKTWPNVDFPITTQGESHPANPEESSSKNQDTGTLIPLNTGQWAYGCDVCQDVCPWNRFSTPHNEPLFTPREMIHWSTSHWKEAVREPARIKPQLKNSPMQRAGLKKLVDQIQLALNSHSKATQS
jgi:epoxyqueuosine reductase